MLLAKDTEAAKAHYGLMTKIEQEVTIKGGRLGWLIAVNISNDQEPSQHSVSELRKRYTGCIKAARDRLRTSILAIEYSTEGIRATGQREDHVLAVIEDADEALKDMPAALAQE